MPANESLARILQMDCTKSIVRVLSRREEISQKKLSILLVGPVRVWLVRSVLALPSRIDSSATLSEEVLEMVPESTVKLAWVASNDNSADMVSKMFYNPFDQTNSNLFHYGPPCFRENNGVKHISLEMTKCTEKYYPLPDDIKRGKEKD